MPADNISTILIVSAHFYPVIGGTPTHTHYLCTALSELGKDVHLITAGGDAPITDEGAEHDAHLRYTLHRIPTNGKYKQDISFLWRIRKELPTYIAQLHPDIVNVSTGNFVPLVLRFAAVDDVPIVYTVHNVPPEEHPFRHSFGTDTVTSVIRRVYFSGIGILARLTVRFGKYCSLICVSENTKRKLILMGANSKKIHVVGNGISVPSNVYENDRAFGTGTVNILTVAGVIEHKGQLDMVYAMKNIASEIPSAKYYIVGPIRSVGYRDRIISAAKELGIEGSVIITGEVTSEELEKYYHSCDIYVQPSYQEGFCIAILDAMIRGKPVIGTDVGEIAKFVADGRGILLKQPSVQDISSAVLRYVRDPGFRVSSSLMSKNFVEKHYSWKKIGADTLNVYAAAKNR
ncbi:MAG: glycosyltransferase family 4 protein [Methanocalculaceae archaeon]|jgi:glycosyltransferase involved in cell wall biosynthesis|nr:glycosyltransferase family 4 protein [Methanocalculaceae archaeon]